MAVRVGPLDLLASRLASRVLRRNVARAVAPRRHNNGDDSDDEGSSSSIPSPPRHDLVLYEYEGSPWCRLVREHATILDLTLEIRPCPRETLLYGEGAYGPGSRFRPEAMEWYRKKQQKRWQHQQQQQQQQQHQHQQRKSPSGSAREDESEDKKDLADHLTFPLFVDRTRAVPPIRNNNSNTDDNDDDDDDDDDGIVVLTESYDIVCHLWKNYGASVAPTTTSASGSASASASTTTTRSSYQQRRPDQILASSSLPFPIRFLSLAGPSYLRPWPRCGVMRVPSRPLLITLSPSASTSITTTTTTTASSVAITITEHDHPTQPETTKPTTTTATATATTTTTTATAQRKRVSPARTRTGTITLTLYQSEGCPESRLVREALCSLEIPYRSVPVAEGSCNHYHHHHHHELKGKHCKNEHEHEHESNAGAGTAIQIPVLEISILEQHEEEAEEQIPTTTGAIGSDIIDSSSSSNKNKNKNNIYSSDINSHRGSSRSSSRSRSRVEHRIGARDCVDYLRDVFGRHDTDTDTDTGTGTGTTNTAGPTWFDPLPEPNLGREAGGENEIGIGAFTAFVKGSRAMVPPRALE